MSYAFDVLPEAYEHVWKHMELSYVLRNHLKYAHAIPTVDTDAMSDKTIDELHRELHDIVVVKERVAVMGPPPEEGEQ